MSDYVNPQLRYSCFSEPSLVSHSHPRSLSLRGAHITIPYPGGSSSSSSSSKTTLYKTAFVPISTTA